MTSIERSKASYFFDGVTAGVLSQEVPATIRSFLATENLYHSATREIATKLENLSDEFQTTRDRDQGS